MGGLGALFHERVYPGQVSGLILLAPFVGDDLKLFAEIDAAGGPGPWAISQPASAVQRNKTEYQRELWLFLGRRQIDHGLRLKIWLAYGDGDRLLAWNRAVKKHCFAGARISVIRRTHMGSLDKGIHRNSGED